MQEIDPVEANRRGVERLVLSVNGRLRWIQSWDPFTSDIYNERIAFWLYMDDPPAVRQRWIERILLSQNADGGWTYHRSLGRTLGQLFGYDAGAGKSDPHATFLALLALSEYAAAAN